MSPQGKAGRTGSNSGALGIATAALGQEHGLGASRQVGDRLSQLVREDGSLVAVLVWCAAAWHLKALDETAGRDVR